MSYDVACPFCGSGIPCGDASVQAAVSAAIRSERSLIEMAIAERAKRGIPGPPGDKSFEPDCSVNGHQEYWEGKFHGFFNGTNGPVAIVQKKDFGKLAVVEAYKVEFRTINGGWK